MWWILRRIERNQELQMALIDDLNTSLQNLGTDISALIKAESDKIAALISSGGATTAQLQSVKDGLDALDTTVKTATGNIPA